MASPGTSQGKAVSPGGTPCARHLQPTKAAAPWEWHRVPVLPRHTEPEFKQASLQVQACQQDIGPRAPSQDRHLITAAARPAATRSRVSSGALANASRSTVKPSVATTRTCGSAQASESVSTSALGPAVEGEWLT